jgi:thiol-disulfide isomerase/thioredoxin
MKRNLTFLAAALFLFATNSSAQETVSAERVMQKVADKLAAVKQLGYKYSFDYRVPSQDRSTTEQAVAFLDLDPSDSTSQFRFKFTFHDRIDTYNGAERFFLDTQGKKLYVENKPIFRSFGDISLKNSPLSLKYALPRIITDKSIPKKLSLVQNGGRDQYLIEFALYKGVINSAGEIVETGPDLTNRYQLKVDKETHLPVEVVETNDKDDSTMRTAYAEITEKPPAPAALSWYFSTYQKDYTLTKLEKLTLIASGKAAPAFSLAGFPTGPNASLDQFKGKMVLVEFWIAHCGFCIAAVPKLNDIASRYKDRGLELVSINMYDPVATIESFKKKNKPEYKILTGGDSIAKQYGVDSYPALVLIDRLGNVIYSSSGLFEKELEAAIAANLKE